MKNSIKTTVTFKMMQEEARYLSVKLQNTTYVILRNNSLIISLSKEDKGEILCSYNFGNPTYYSSDKMQ